MTGTSLDGVDAALVEIRGTGLDMRATLLDHAETPLTAAVMLRELADGCAMTAEQIQIAAAQLTRDHFPAIERVLRGTDADLIVVHGQTVLHRPPLSWQLVLPQLLCERFGTAIVSDLRASDLASGGQGAPLTPLADWVLFRDAGMSRAILNLGGFANVTRIPASCAEPHRMLRGGDVCPCNHVLDAIARERLGMPFDPDGLHAERGTVDSDLAARLAVILGSTDARSLGTGDEGHEKLGTLSPLSPGDACATACRAIAILLRDALLEDDIVIAGGGSRNARLYREIEWVMERGISTTQPLGVSPGAREAACFAVLGALAQDRVPIAVPAITGGELRDGTGSWIYP